MENIEANLTNTTKPDLPWLYDIDPGDTNWIITSSFMIFTMQTGIFANKIISKIYNNKTKRFQVLEC